MSTPGSPGARPGGGRDARFGELGRNRGRELLAPRLLLQRLAVDGWGNIGLIPVPLGAHLYGPELLSAREPRFGSVTGAVESARLSLAQLGPLVLADTPGGDEELRRLVDPRLRDVVETLHPSTRIVATSFVWGTPIVTGRRSRILGTAVRVPDGEGRLAGTVLVPKPEANMSLLATVTALGDLRHFNQMQSVAQAGRRAAAILFADLESSSQLARRLSTASYFSLARRMVRAADQCVVDNAGLVGRHVGDGVVAFFLAETAGSESKAARSCIQTANDLRAALSEVAARSDVPPEDLMMRFGLHWGSTVYVGQIATSGRTEVTALGDAVNEAARIEASAAGGRTLASKNLIERLEPDDADALGLDPDRVTYSALATLPSASEKARRDAPAIAVCEI